MKFFNPRKFYKENVRYFHENSKILEVLVYTALAVAVFFFLNLAQTHLPMTNQFIIGWGSIFVVIILKRIERFKKPPLRIIFVTLCIFLTVRYMIWRTTETLVYSGPIDFTAMFLLYMAEVYAVTVHLLGSFSYIWPLENKIMPLPVDESLYPSVAIFIPTYNESLDIVKVTAISALSVDYPKDKLKVYILDDGGTLAKRNNPETSQAAWERHYELRRVAQKIGANYITRESNVSAKAGNLNHALNHTKSDLLMVLDCDHVPTRDILRNTVGWFMKDEKVAFVQTPHFFMNPNPVERNLGIYKDAPSEDDMFYRAIHPGLDSWNSSFFCGSAAILKRRCLEEVGGISGETITEDCETAVALHKKGYKSVYITRPMVCGLAPETLDSFIKQRSRWAQGMTQIFILDNPLFAKGLKFYQKLCYFNVMLYWFFGFARIIFFIAPAAYLLLGLKIYFASVTQVLAYAIPHVVGSLILMDFFYGKFRWPFFSELYENVQSMFLIRSVTSVIINPTKPTFKVTSKGGTLDKEYLSRRSIPFFFLCLVIMIAVPVAVVKLFRYPLYREATVITLVWCLFNLTVALATFGAFFEKKQERNAHRIWAKGNKLLITLPRLNKRVEAEFQDISVTGMGVSFKLPYPLMPLEHMLLESRNSHGEKFEIEARLQREIKKGDTYFCGIQFIVQDEKQIATAVKFVYGDSQRWLNFWWQKTRNANPLVVFFSFVIAVGNGFKAMFIALAQFIFIPASKYLKRFLTPERPAIDPNKPIWLHIIDEILLGLNYVKRFLNFTYRLINRSEA